MDSFNYTCHPVKVIHWLFDQSSMFSRAAVCISCLIKAPLGCSVYSRGIFIQRQGWAVQGWGSVGGTPVGEIKPKSHLMLIKDSETCLTHIFFPLLLYAGHFFQMFCIYRASLFLIWIRMNWKVSHISKWVKVSAHLLVPNGKTAEMNGASSADQVLLWGVSLLHSLIIVGSCLLMTQSSSTENHYPGCDGDSECSVQRGLL